MPKGTALVDLDGVLNKYRGWLGEDYIHPPRDDAKLLLAGLKEFGYRVVIFTTRKPMQVWAWLKKHGLAALVEDVTDVKGPAVILIDDRAICFDGDVNETLAKAAQFQTHWEKANEEIFRLP